VEKVTINAQALANATVLQSMGKADAITFIANQTGIEPKELTNLFLWLETLREMKPNFIYITGQNQTSSFIYPLPQLANHNLLLFLETPSFFANVTLHLAFGCVKERTCFSAHGA